MLSNSTFFKLSCSKLKSKTSFALLILYSTIRLCNICSAAFATNAVSMDHSFSPEDLQNPHLHYEILRISSLTTQKSLSSQNSQKDSILTQEVCFVVTALISSVKVNGSIKVYFSKQKNLFNLLVNK